MNPGLRKHLLSLLLAAIVILMGIEILYLINQNRRLRSMISNARQYYQPLRQDEQVQSFNAEDLSGNPVRLQYSADQPYTLMLWFSASCSSCEANLYFWQEIYRNYSSDHLRVLGMCTDGPEKTREMAAEYGLSFPIIHVESQSLVEAYKGNVVPQTMLVSPEGAIRGVWPGPLSEDHKEGIIAALTQLDTLDRERR